MKVAAAFVASLGLASAFMAPAPKFGRSRGMVKASVEDLIGASPRLVCVFMFMGCAWGVDMGCVHGRCVGD